MCHYYHIDSDGDEHTNLQLYSLRQAQLYWSELENDLTKSSHPKHLHERCVFVICTIGLSISQLLGQNNPSPSERIPPPYKIFGKLVDKNKLNPKLKSQFKTFSDAYDHCRHFGLTSNGHRHQTVGKFTPEKTRDLYDFGLQVWKIVINIFLQD